MLCHGRCGPEVTEGQPELPRRRALKREGSFAARSALVATAAEGRAGFPFAPHHLPALPTGPGEKTISFSVTGKGWKLSWVPMLWTEKIAYVFQLATFKDLQRFCRV